MEQKKENQGCRKNGKPIYQKPVLMEYNTRRAAGTCSAYGMGAVSSCNTGNVATSMCGYGNGALAGGTPSP